MKIKRLLNKTNKQGSLVIAFLCLILITSCTGSTVIPSKVVVSTPSPTPFEQPEQGDLSEEQTKTLNSLEKVDDHPLYTMQYYGNYPGVGSSRTAFSLPLPWGCSLFAALGDLTHKLYGRNFDWEHSPALLLFTQPLGGYASVSMVDISYLGFKDGKASNLLDLPLADRQGLLDAPYLPFDGMNEMGLVVGMAAVDPGNMESDAAKQTIDSIYAIRLMLDSAKNVDEAVAILQSYNIDMGGGPPLHYLVADRSGHSVLVEFYEGKIMVIPNTGSWHLATNFLVSSVGDKTTGHCMRYDRISQEMEKNSGKLSSESALGLLESVAQGNTQWSVVYGIDSGEVKIVLGSHYDQVHTFNLTPRNP